MNNEYSENQEYDRADEIRSRSGNNTYHETNTDTEQPIPGERNDIHDGQNTADAYPESKPVYVRKPVNGIAAGSLSRSDIRRRRIRRRNQDLAIRIALIFLTGFLCGSLFTGLFFRPASIPAAAVANSPEENPAALDETAAMETPEAGQPPAGLVVIDAGHGGKDPGCMESSVWESELNLQMAMKLQKKLEAKGVQVLMTRTDDEVTLSLAERAELANDHNADVFISIHQNSYTSSQISGIEFFYKEGEAGSETLAGLFEKNIQSDGSIKSRGIKASGDLKVLRLSKGTAILIESGYLTNPAEEKNLLSDSYQDKLMGYIADGIMEFLEQ